MAWAAVAALAVVMAAYVVFYFRMLAKSRGFTHPSVQQFTVKASQSATGKLRAISKSVTATPGKVVAREQHVVKQAPPKLKRVSATMSAAKPLKHRH